VSAVLAAKPRKTQFRTWFIIGLMEAVMGGDSQIDSAAVLVKLAKLTSTLEELTRTLAQLESTLRKKSSESLKESDEKADPKRNQLPVLRRREGADRIHQERVEEASQISLNNCEQALQGTLGSLSERRSAQEQLASQRGQSVYH
jgi:hypothetical protein